VRKQAIETLKKMKDIRAVEALVLVLKDNDPAIQQEAANALLAIGWQPKDDAQRAVLAVIMHDWDSTVSLGAVAVELLVGVLKNGDAKDRIAVAEALGKIGDRRAVEPLIATLQDRDSKVRERAAWALGQIEDPRAVEPLVALLENGEKKERVADETDGTAAAEALGHLGSAAVEPLLAILRGNHESRVRGRAMEALGQIGDPRTVGTLAAALQDHELSVSSRIDAAEVLARMGDPRGVELLVSVLQDGNQYAWVRVSIIKKLVQIKDVRSMEALEAALKDDELLVGRAAAEALGEIGDRRAIKALETALRESSYAIKQDVTRALNRLGWRPETDALRAELAILRIDWNRAISLGVVAVEPLVAVLKYENAKGVAPHVEDLQAQAGRVRAAAETLGRIGVTGMEALIAVLKDKNYRWRIRRTVAETLSQMGNVRAFGPLVTLTTDGEVAQIATGALQKLLESNASEIPLEDLQRVVTLNEVVQIVHQWDTCGGFLSREVEPSSKRIDCTQIRQLARQELIRRGLEA
jgi:HEAT repeat protein